MQYCRDLVGGAGVQCGCADGFKLEADGQRCSATGNTQTTTVTTVTSAHNTTVTTAHNINVTSAHNTTVTTAHNTTVTTGTVNISL